MGKKVLCFAIVLLAMSTAAQAAYNCTQIKPMVGDWDVTLDNGTTYTYIIANKDFLISNTPCSTAVVGEGIRNPGNVEFIIAWPSFVQDASKHVYVYKETEHPDNYTQAWLNANLQT
ncbi:MAG: hypothetical protein NTX06_05050, partial [Proteobacteria bacterium]|nr:hypothetical protein [Pseudomonadota bacterium]